MAGKGKIAEATLNTPSKKKILSSYRLTWWHFFFPFNLRGILFASIARNEGAIRRQLYDSLWLWWGDYFAVLSLICSTHQRQKHWFIKHKRPRQQPNCLYYVPALSIFLHKVLLFALHIYFQETTLPNFSRVLTSTSFFSPTPLFFLGSVFWSYRYPL